MSCLMSHDDCFPIGRQSPDYNRIVSYCPSWNSVSYCWLPPICNTVSIIFLILQFTTFYLYIGLGLIRNLKRFCWLQSHSHEYSKVCYWNCQKRSC